MIKKLLDDPSKAGKSSVLWFKKRQRERKNAMKKNDTKGLRRAAFNFIVYSPVPLLCPSPASKIYDYYTLNSIISLKRFPPVLCFYVWLYLDSSARMHPHQMDQCKLWRAEH